MLAKIIFLAIFYAVILVLIYRTLPKEKEQKGFDLINGDTIIYKGELYRSIPEPFKHRCTGCDLLDDNHECILMEQQASNCNGVIWEKEEIKLNKD